MANQLIAWHSIMHARTHTHTKKEKENSKCIHAGGCNMPIAKSCYWNIFYIFVVGITDETKRLKVCDTLL